MKLYLQDILKHKIFRESLPDAFAKLKKGEYYVFYYDYDDQFSAIEVKGAKTLLKINDAIYRGMGAYNVQNVGYFKEPFDSRSTLFYVFLKQAVLNYYIQTSLPHRKYSSDESYVILNSRVMNQTEQKWYKVYIYPDEKGNWYDSVIVLIEEKTNDIAQERPAIKDLIHPDDVFNTNPKDIDFFEFGNQAWSHFSDVWKELKDLLTMLQNTGDYPVLNLGALSKIDATSSDALLAHRNKLDEIFAEWMAEDIKQMQSESAAKKIKTFDIHSGADIESALNSFTFKRQLVSGMVKITDLLNSYFEAKKGYPLYQQNLTKIVKAVKNPNGGLIPESNGTLRYMIVGEKAFTSKNDPALEEAKRLFRGGADRDRVFFDTGWYNNPFDGMWRKKISDISFKVKTDNIHDVDVNGDAHKFYIPNNSPVSEDAIITAFIGNMDAPAQAIAKGYNGKIVDVVHHPDLFEAYPQIQDLTLFYGQKVDVLNKRQSYYYSNRKPSHLMFFGYTEPKNQYILLHEMQHWIQHFENFASGGNPFLASMLNAIGGSSVKQWILSHKKISDAFCNQIDKYDREAFVDFAKSIYAAIPRIRKNENILELAQNLASLAANDESFKANCQSVIDATTQLYEYARYYDLKSFYTEQFEPSIMDFFNLSADSMKQTEQEAAKMTKGGYSAWDVKLLFHNIYKSLGGEFESREVQQTVAIPSQFRQYFKFYSSEKLAQGKVNVMNNDGMMPVPEKIVGACEKDDDGKYVIHLFDTVSAEPYLHELGHIVYDVVEEMPENQVVIAAFDEYGKGWDSIDEWFVENFLNYIAVKRLDSVVADDLMKNRKVSEKEYKALEGVFDQIFLVDSSLMNVEKLTQGLAYVKLLQKSA